MKKQIMSRSRSIWFFHITLIIALTGCKKAEPIDIKSLTIYLPAGTEVFLHGTNCNLNWNSEGLTRVDIDLYKGPDTLYPIASRIENSDKFTWKVSSNIPEGRNYYLKVSDSDNPDLVFDSSRRFSIIPQSEYSSFRDSRDEHNYKTVKIGKQWWMAENFRFVADEGSYSYADVPGNSTLFGRLYTLQSAIDNAPEGWHLPSDDEWKELELYMGIDRSEIDNTGGRGAFAGTLLKEGGGTGFNALYGGYHNSCVDYYAHMLWEGHFWTSTITQDNKPVIRIIRDGSGEVARLNSFCHDRCSVRYIKD